ncbi:MAG TPA: hypothetical protein VIJ34_00715 [Acidimicrobiales bacterium]
MRELTPKRFFAQHLDMFKFSTGENSTGYFDSFEEANKASDEQLETYADHDVRANVRQEITDTDTDVTWTRLGHGPWSLQTPPLQ